MYSFCSPDTSSYNSECQDDEEIALALQAAEIASRNKARARFKSSRDLLHKLFVCVSGKKNNVFCLIFIQLSQNLDGNTLFFFGFPYSLPFITFHHS